MGADVDHGTEPGSPLFVLGSPRSGTSLLRLLLTSHPKVVVPPECGFMVWLQERYGDWSIENTRDAGCRREFIAELIECRKFETWKLSPESIENEVIEYSPANYGQLCRAIYLLYGHYRGKEKIEIWGDKNNYYIHHLPLLDSIYPEARYLHIVRDGRDVACSYIQLSKERPGGKYAPELPSNIQDIAREWSRNVSMVNTFLSDIDKKRCRSVRYEDLVEDSQARLSEVFEWLDLELHADVNRFWEINRQATLEPAATIAWKKKTLEPLTNSSIGRYRNEMSSVEQGLFEEIARPNLLKHGYAVV